MADGLEMRIERLERQNRRLKAAVLVPLVLAGGVVLMGQASPPAVSELVRACSPKLVG